MAGKKLGLGHCVLCNRQTELTFHHFFPRSIQNNKWFFKRYTKKQMQTEGCGLCWECHSFIHITFSEKELGRNFTSIESFLENEQVKDFLLFIRKQKNTISNKLLKRR